MEELTDWGKFFNFPPNPNPESYDALDSFELVEEVSENLSHHIGWRKGDPSDLYELAMMAATAVKRQLTEEEIDVVRQFCKRNEKVFEMRREAQKLKEKRTRKAKLAIKQPGSLSVDLERSLTKEEIKSIRN